MILSHQTTAAVFLMLVNLVQMHDLGLGNQRIKRIVVGNGSLTLPPRPLPIGSLSTFQGEADCYFINSRFYCISQFQASFYESNQYCNDGKMKLLFLENEDEHEYLYDFMSSNTHKSATKFLLKSDFSNEEEYSSYVFKNISPGMIVKCASICGRNVRPLIDEGRVLNFEDREYVGLAVKVQWKTGIVRWYPAQNLQIGGFYGALALEKHRPNEELFTLEENIFEPGDKVRIRKNSSSPPPSAQRPGLNSPLEEIGIISDLDFVGGNALVYFPSNKGWRGLLTDLEIVDKRKGWGTYWTSGINNQSKGWVWSSTNQSFIFTNWALPIEGLTGEYCLEIQYHMNGKWYTANCSERNYFICIKSLTER